MKVPLATRPSVEIAGILQFLFPLLRKHLIIVAANNGLSLLGAQIKTMPVKDSSAQCVQAILSDQNYTVLDRRVCYPRY